MLSRGNSSVKVLAGDTRGRKAGGVGCLDDRENLDGEAESSTGSDEAEAASCCLVREVGCVKQQVLFISRVKGKGKAKFRDF